MLGDLMDEYDVIAPTDHKGKVRFTNVSSTDDILFDYTSSHYKPTEMFFPQCEILFEADSGENVAHEPPQPEKPALVFGLRPCDARSVRVLDKVFHWDGLDDPYYFNKRNNALLMVVGCNEPRSTCFCTSVGGGPADTTGADIFLTELPEAYSIEAVSEKGKQFLEKIDDSLQDASEAEEKEVARVRQHAEEMIDHVVDIGDLPEKLEEMFDHEIWDELHAACLACGTCAYLCPTCHCFDILDKKRGHNVQRVRFWDCCMYPKFTLHASGHNPRASQRERIRQRMLHKFQYYVENFDEVACVGCGRCIINCPANLDIREILKKLKHAAEHVKT